LSTGAILVLYYLRSSLFDISDNDSDVHVDLFACMKYELKLTARACLRTCHSIHACEALILKPFLYLTQWKLVYLNQERHKQERKLTWSASYRRYGRINCNTYSSIRWQLIQYDQMKYLLRSNHQGQYTSVKPEVHRQERKENVVTPIEGNCQNILCGII
jgi:hypothetical protein